MSLRCQGWPRLGPRPETAEEIRAREQAVLKVVAHIEAILRGVSEDGCEDNLKVRPNP